MRQEERRALKNAPQGESPCAALECNSSGSRRSAACLRIDAGSAGGAAGSPPHTLVNVDVAAWALKPV